MRLLYKVGIIAITLALAVLAFPISTAAAQSHEQTTIFIVDPSLRQTQAVNPPGPTLEATTQPQATKKLIAKPAPKPNIAPTEPRGRTLCSCVLTAKALTGFNQSVGNARYWPVNTTTAVVGGVLVENISRAGHVSVIIAVSNEGVTVKEGNYKRCSFTEGRFIPYGSPTIIGFWQP